MKIHYSSKRLKRILEDEILIKRNYGAKDGASICNRLSELRAANSLNEIPATPPPRRHKLQGNKDGCWAVSYSKNNRIIFKPQGEFDIERLETIKEIEIINLEDYH